MDDTKRAGGGWVTIKTGLLKFGNKIPKGDPFILSRPKLWALLDAFGLKIQGESLGGLFSEVL